MIPIPSSNYTIQDIQDNDVVSDVKAQITIYFQDGLNGAYSSSFQLGVASSSAVLQNYCTNLTLNEQLTSKNKNSILGNIAGNTLSLKITSNDRTLIPNNTLSPYYGYMDNTAIIDVMFTFKHKTTGNTISVFMGRFFVDSWEGGTSASTSNQITISAVNLYSKLKNISLARIKNRTYKSFVDYLLDIVNKINSSLTNQEYHLRVEQDSNNDYIGVDIFKNLSYDWQLVYNNIDRDTVETLFNNIVNDTISFIWVDRQGYIRCDNLLDDQSEQSLTSLTGSTNLFEYSVTTGDYSTNSGLRVTYINKINIVRDELLRLSDIELLQGTNQILNKTMKFDNVYDIEQIELICENGTAKCLSFDYYKKSLNLVVLAEQNTKADIVVYGRHIDEDTSSITKYQNDEKQSTLLDIKNRTLRKEIIGRYTDGLLFLMQCKNNQVNCSGYINPCLKLGDVVTFTGLKFNVSGLYKIVGLKYTLNGASYRCTAQLLNTSNIDIDVDTILYDQIRQLEACLRGGTINPLNIQDISAANDATVQADAVVAELLNELDN